MIKPALKKNILCIILITSSFSLVAQDTTGTKQEVWPEVNVFYKINNKLRLFALYSATKLRNSSYTDGGYGIYADYFAFPFDNKK